MGTINEDILVEFADRHLAPYQIKDKLGGREIVPALCPICQGGRSGDKHTFALSIDKLVYVCKRGNCDAHGRVEELFKLFGENTTTIRRDMKVSNLTMRQQKFSLPKTEMLPVTQQIYDYFALRKISKETVDAFRIAADPKGMIVFPFYEDGVNVFVKFRRPYKPSEDEAKKAKEWREPNTKAVLFHMDDCVFDEPLYITEGEIDAMSLYQAGITNVVSVPSGCDDTSWIENCFDWLEKFEIIVLFGDNDAPGRKMVNDVAKRLDESRCMIVEEYPDRPLGSPCKDANEILYYHGETILRKTAENAENIEVGGLIDIADVAPYDPTAVKRIAFGIPTLDEMLGGMEEGCITIISGKSGEGKSTITNQFILNAVQQKKKVAVYSGEMKASKLKYWLSLQAAGSDYIGLKWDEVRHKDVPFITWEVQNRIQEWLRGNVFLFDNEQKRPDGEHEIDTVLRMFTAAARRSSPFLFVIDNVMSLISDQSEEISAQRSMIVKLKSFAQRFKCHIILIAHPRKSGTKENDVLNKDSIAGSSSMVNFCDSAFSVERPNIRVLKNRDGGCSRVIECCYMSDCRKIYQADRGDTCRDYGWDKSGVRQPEIKANTMYGITMAETSPF